MTDPDLWEERDVPTASRFSPRARVRRYRLRSGQILIDAWLPGPGDGDADLMVDGSEWHAPSESVARELISRAFPDSAPGRYDGRFHCFQEEAEPGGGASSS